MDSKRHGGNLNLFVFGVLVGVAATLLLTTKKGRKLLKALTDEGVDKLSQLENMVKEIEIEEEEDEYDADEEGPVGESEVSDYVEEPERRGEKKIERIEVKSRPKIGEMNEKEESSKSRKRLFRGIRKKTAKT